MAVDLEKKEPVADVSADLLPKANRELAKGENTTYELYEVLGRGGFGAVYKIRRAEDDKFLAMKCESAAAKKALLHHEVNVLLAAKKVGSPHLLHYEDRGSVRDRFKFVVIRLAGKNLWELRMSQPGRRFNMATSLRLAEQSLAGIRDLHRAGYLHRDIKPPNFALGREEDQSQHTVVILDFGLCRRFGSSPEHDARHPRAKAAFRGTTRYASVNCLELKEQCRKDDIESWWYMVVEWTIGNLPWRSCKGSERKVVLDYKKVLRETTNLNKMLRDCPTPYLADILRYVDGLGYTDIPDYDHVYFQLAAAMKANGCNLQAAPEWDSTVDCWKGPRYQLGVDFGIVEVQEKKEETKE